MILSVLKEELPEERKSNFWAFATGAVAYAALLLTNLSFRIRYRSGLARL